MAVAACHGAGARGEALVEILLIDVPDRRIDEVAAPGFAVAADRDDRLACRAGPALAWPGPVVEVTEFDARTQNYTMSAVSTEGDKTGDDAIRVLSSDGLEVTIDLSVLYRVSPTKTPFILQNLGTEYVEKIVRPIARTAIRDNAVSYEAVSLYSTKRAEFQSKIYNAISAAFAKNGIELQSVLVRNITLPASVKASIESKINAEQDAQKMQFVLQKERQEADRKRVEAQGIADYQKILSTGLSDKQLQYEAIKAQKEIALSPNAKVIIMGGKPGSIILGKE